LTKQHILLPISFWDDVIFAVESKLNIFGSDGRQFVWRRPNTELENKHLKPTVKHGGGDVIVLACMAASGVGNLIAYEIAFDFTRTTIRSIQLEL